MNNHQFCSLIQTKKEEFINHSQCALYFEQYAKHPSRLLLNLESYQQHFMEHYPAVICKPGLLLYEYLEIYQHYIHNACLINHNIRMIIFGRTKCTCHLCNILLFLYDQGNVNALYVENFKLVQQIIYFISSLILLQTIK